MLSKTLKLLSVVGILTSLVACSGLSAVKNDQVVMVEAESVTKEVGGKVVKRGDRPGTSAGQCISGWDDKGHALEYRVNIAQSGNYKIVMRYSTARSWDVLRSLTIDGKSPNPALAQIAWKTTGGWGTKPEQWSNLLITDAANKPVTVYLERGERVLTINNLGGTAGGANGSANLDVIALVGESADVTKVLATLGQAK